jgi:hypothetical protein
MKNIKRWSVEAWKRRSVEALAQTFAIPRFITG